MCIFICFVRILDLMTLRATILFVALLGTRTHAVFGFHTYRENNISFSQIKKKKKTKTEKIKFQKAKLLLIAD